MYEFKYRPHRSDKKKIGFRINIWVEILTTILIKKTK
jgi:hypothetical protein